MGGVYEAWDAPVETVSPWSAWTVSSSTCAACPAPSTQTVTDWVSTSSACPSGQQGSITWEYQQSRSRSVSYNCPAGTTSLPPATLGGWSSWSNTGATRNTINGCAAACSAPAPEWRPAPYKGACPAGMTGTGSNWTTGERRTWTCPSPSGSPTTTGWVWDGTPGVFVDNGDCAANCVAPAPESRWLTSTSPCPSGGTESIEYREQRSASCPSPTGSYVWGSWADTGDRRNYVACPPAPPTCSAPAPSSTAISRSLTNETRDAGCPFGQSGQHIQSRTRTESGTRTTTWACPGPTSSTSDSWSGSVSYGTWATVSNSCQVELVSCFCSGSLYNGVAFYPSRGSYPTLAACNADKGAAETCEPEVLPSPSGGSCYHLMPIHWKSNTLAEWVCTHI